MLYLSKIDREDLTLEEIKEATLEWYELDYRNLNIENLSNEDKLKFLKLKYAIQNSK